MDGSPLPELYQRYKLGTKHVVQWLANAARQCCDLRTVLPHIDFLNSATQTEKTLTELSTSDVVRLARELSRQAAPTRPAPSGIDSAISILNNVIAGRRECGAWYQRCSTDGSDEKQDKDKSHQHFVEALSEALDHLKQTQANSKKPAAVVAEPHGSAVDPIGDALTNAFSALLVEEPSASFQNQPEQPKRTKKSRRAAKVTKHAVAFDLKAGQDEVFALWCLLRGCHDIRTYISTIWADYYRRELDLLTATKITDVAFNLIRQTAAAFVRDFPGLGDFNKVADRFNVRVTASGEKIEAFDCDTAGLSTSASSAIEARELLCAPAWTTANILREALVRFESRSADMFDPSHHIHAGHLFGSKLYDAFLELQDLRDDPTRLHDIHGGDVFMQMTMEFLGNYRTLHLDFIIAFQIYMDMYDAAGASTKRLSRLYTHIRWVYVASPRASLATFRDSIGNAPETGKYGERFAELSRSMDIEHSVGKAFGAPLIDLLMAMPTEEKREIADSTRPILEYFPVMSGYLAGIMMQHKQEVGMEFCNFGAVFHASAHLYTACRNSGLLRRAWPDMDFLITQQGAKRLGMRVAGDTTKPMISAAKNFGMSLGVELRDYVKLRTRGQKGSTQRVRLPAYSVLLRNMERVKQTSVFTNTVRECAASYQCLGSSVSAGSSACCAALHQFARKVPADPTSGVDERLRNECKESLGLSPVQLLSLLRTHLVAEEDHLAFDYHFIFAACTDLLEALKVLYGNQISSMRLARGVGDDYMLHELAYEILWEAADAESSGQRVSGFNTILGKVAVILDTRIQAGGSACLEHARSWSHGQIPFELRTDLPLAPTPRADATGYEMALLGNVATLTAPAVSAGRARLEERVKQTLTEQDRMIKKGVPSAQINAFMDEEIEMVTMKRELEESEQKKYITDADQAKGN